MSGYNMEYFLGDFAKRTIDNLKFVEDGADEYKLYEVTQLINSLLGLIIIPVEHYKKTYRIKDEKIRESSPDDYNTIVDIIDVCAEDHRFYSDYEGDQDKNGRISVSKFINHIRNSIAHGGNNGIHFYPVSESGIISNIIFYDNDFVIKKGIHEFCISLKISELKTLVCAISGLYCKFEKRDNDIRKKQEKYLSDIRKLEGLLKNERPDNKTKVIFELEESELF